jgi:hypothetical protein
MKDIPVHMHQTRMRLSPMGIATGTFQLGGEADAHSTQDRRNIASKFTKNRYWALTVSQAHSRALKQRATVRYG